MNDIEYKTEESITPEEFRKILQSSGLGERRPVDDTERLAVMCRNANLIVSARMGDKLVGIARSLSDFAYCTYLSDLAVDKEFQHLGVGKELIRRTKEAAPRANLILLSAPAATNYYPKIGFEKHEFAFMLRKLEDLK